MPLSATAENPLQTPTTTTNWDEANDSVAAFKARGQYKPPSFGASFQILRIHSDVHAPTIAQETDAALRIQAGARGRKAWQRPPHWDVNLFSESHCRRCDVAKKKSRRSKRMWPPLSTMMHIIDPPGFSLSSPQPILLFQSLQYLCFMLPSS